MLRYVDGGSGIGMFAAGVMEEVGEHRFEYARIERGASGGDAPSMAWSWTRRGGGG